MTAHADEPAPGPIAPGGEVGAAIEGLRSRAPRLRLAALVLVGLVVVVMIGFAVVAPDPTVVALVSLEGRVCATVEDRVWASSGPVLPPAEGPSSVEGTWRVTGAGAAELTTPSGRVIPMRTDQDAGDGPGATVSCALVVS